MVVAASVRFSLVLKVDVDLVSHSLCSRTAEQCSKLQKPSDKPDGFLAFLPRPCRTESWERSCALRLFLYVSPRTGSTWAAAVSATKVAGIGSPLVDPFIGGSQETINSLYLRRVVADSARAYCSTP